MTKQNLNNIYSSEVYRELERQAIRKGFFTPTETEIVKTAAMNVSNTKDTVLKESGNLLQDIAILTSELRKKGLDTYAENIEQNLLIYKQAENLYNIEIDTAKNLAEFAHREGDVQVVDGGELGVVETAQSAADKILAVTKKEPTGQYPKKLAFKNIVNLIKNAQDPVAEDIITTVEETSSGEPAKEVISPKVQSYTEAIKNSLQQLADMLTKSQTFNLTGILNDDGTSNKNYLLDDKQLENLFNTVLGSNAQLVKNFGLMFKTAYRGKPASKETIYNFLLSQMDAPQVYLYPITIGSHKTYKTAQYAIPMSGSPQEQEKLKAKQEKLEQFKPKAEKLANEIYTDIIKAQNSATSAVNTAANKLEELKKLINNEIDTISKYTEQELTTKQSYMSFVLNLRIYLNKLQNKIKGIILPIFIGFNDKSTADNINTFNTVLLDGLQNVKDELLNSVTDKVDEKQINSIVSSLKELKTKLENAMKEYPDELNKQAKTLNNIIKMINTIAINYLGGTAYLLKSLEVIDKYKSIEDLNKDVQSLQTFLTNLIDNVNKTKRGV